MKKIWVSLLVVSMIMFLASPAFAGRPLNTEDSGTAGKGTVVLEVSHTSIEEKNGDVDSGQCAAIAYGITDNLDIVVEKAIGNIKLLNLPQLYCVGDTAIFVKYRFIEETEHSPSIGVKAAVDLQDGNANGSSGVTEFGANFFASKEFNGTMIHGNLGYTTWNSGGVVNYAIALEQPVGEKFTLVGEVFGESEKAGMGPLMAQLGASYAITSGITLDVGYARGINDAAPRSAITIGAAIEF